MKSRKLILSRMVLARHEETLTVAKQRFAGLDPIPVELKSVVYQGALMIKGIPIDVLKTLFRRYREAPSLEEKECIIHSFDAVSDPELIQDVLEFANSATVRPSETMQIVRVANTKAGRELSWQFFKANQKLFQEGLGQRVGYTKIVQAITENYTSTAKASETYAYFRDKFSTCPGLERTVLQVEEKIHINKEWLNRDSALIEDYLSTYE